MQQVIRRRTAAVFDGGTGLVMGALALDIFLVTLAAVVGGGTGWFLRGGGPLEPISDPEADEALRRARSDLAGTRETLQAKDQENNLLTVELDAARLEATRAKEALAELHRVAANMAADVDQHNRSVQEISEGLDEDADPGAIIQCVEQLFAANNKMQTQLQSAEQELEEKQKEIASHLHEARTDALTSLANRRAFDIEMERCEREYKNNGVPSSVMVIDVDHFKKFNDTYGHQIGDDVLRAVAGAMKGVTRGGELFARYGGEEFVVILPEVTPKAMMAVAERIRTRIEATKLDTEDGRTLSVTISVGGACTKSIKSFEDGTELLKIADSCLYEAKETGRNRWRLFVRC